MSGDLDHNLEQATCFFHQAIEKERRGETDQARRYYLQAAEKLFLAAAQSGQDLRESRKHLAQNLYNQAQKLEKEVKKTTLVSPGRKESPALNLGDEEQASGWLVRERPAVRFEDIAGLEAVKEQIRLKLLYPFTHPDTAARYGIQPGGGILLYGPPGTGKTMIARAVAGEIEAAFFAIKPSEIMSQWVGVAEQNIARLFAEASAYERSVVFIDEIEALSPKRRSSISTVMVRVVPQLLAELDGFHKRENALLMIGATNEPWAIDAAILRPGRLDRLIYVPPPDLPARQKILELNLKNAPLAEMVDLGEYAARTQNFSGADMAAVAQRVRERVFSQAVHQGIERPIQAEDFEAVLSEMRPSIPAADLRLFEQFAAGGAVKR